MQECLPHETICPVCLEQYDSGVIAVAYDACPACSGEAIDHPVEKFSEYLARKSIEDFEAMLQQWRSSTRFSREYRDLRIGRILALKLLKQKPL